MQGASGAHKTVTLPALRSLANTKPNSPRSTQAEGATAYLQTIMMAAPHLVGCPEAPEARDPQPSKDSGGGGISIVSQALSAKHCQPSIVSQAWVATGFRTHGRPHHPSQTSKAQEA